MLHSGHYKSSYIQCIQTLHTYLQYAMQIQTRFQFIKHKNTSTHDVETAQLEHAALDPLSLFQNCHQLLLNSLGQHPIGRLDPHLHHARSAQYLAVDEDRSGRDEGGGCYGFFAWKGGRGRGVRDGREGGGDRKGRGRSQG